MVGFASEAAASPLARRDSSRLGRGPGKGLDSG